MLKNDMNASQTCGHHISIEIHHRSRYTLTQHQKKREHNKHKPKLTASLNLWWNTWLNSVAVLSSTQPNSKLWLFSLKRNREEKTARLEKKRQIPTTTLDMQTNMSNEKKNGSKFNVFFLCTVCLVFFLV